MQRGVGQLAWLAVLWPLLLPAQGLDDLLSDLSSAENTGRPAPQTSAADPVRSLVDKYSPSWIEGNGRVAPAIAAPGLDQEFRYELPAETETESTPHQSSGKSYTPPGQHILQYGMHYCFFADPATPEDKMDQKIRLIVQRYAECGIAVQPHTYTLTTNYPRDPARLGRMARKACDVKQRYGERGAVQVDVDNDQIAEDMCSEKGAVGCSSLCETVSFSVVGPGGSAAVGLHESGHSNCCQRFCVDTGRGRQAAGNGLELAELFTPRQTVAAAESNIKGGSFNSAACESLRKGATKRKEGYQDQSKQPRFYKRALGAMQFDITQGRPALEREPAPGPEDEKFDPDNVVSEGLMNAYLASIAPHKLVPDASFRPLVAGSVPNSVVGGSTVEGESERTGPQNIVYNEGAGKNPAPGGMGAASGGNRGLASVKSDEEAPATPEGSKSAERLTMDEKAPKNGAKLTRGATRSGGVLTEDTRGAGGKSGYGKKRKRGSTFKRGHPIQEQAEDLVSARPPGDFGTEPVVEGGGGEE